MATKDRNGLKLIEVDNLERAEEALVTANNELMAEVQKATHPEWAFQIDQLGESARDLLRLVRNTRSLKKDRG